MYSELKDNVADELQIENNWEESICLFWTELHILHAEMCRSADELVDVGKYPSGPESTMHVIWPREEKI